MSDNHQGSGMSIGRLQTVAKSTRGSFLILTPACVFLGLSIGISRDVSIDWILLFLVTGGALLAHIAVNTWNEYEDFKSGLDLITRRTAFSGGSGALPNNPDVAQSVRVTAILSVLMIIGLGVVLIWKTGLAILPIGIVGILLIVLYTRWINRNPYVCLVAPGLGFGLLMVLGTERVLTGSFSNQGLLASIVPFFLVNNLLLLNQYPDIDADKTVGRNHLPIAFGVNVGNWVYLWFAMIAMMVILVASILGYFPLVSVISLIAIVPVLFVFSGVAKLGKNIGSEPMYLAVNVAVTIFTPVILGISFLLA
jgi:1,4-dihydroxy-2-naphthoate octaprenyltransferase